MGTVSDDSICDIRSAGSRMPAEITETIIALLISACGKDAQRDLPIWATVSRGWQAAIERRTFHTICLTYSRVVYAQHLHIFGVRRQSLVREIKFASELPEYDESAPSCFESQDDQLRNNRAFTSDIAVLFDFLAPWPALGHEMHLHIKFYSPSDPYQRGGGPSRQRRGLFISPRDNMTKMRFSRSYLDLDTTDLGGDDDSLPKISIVTNFSIKKGPSINGRVGHLTQGHEKDVLSVAILEKSKQLETLMVDGAVLGPEVVAPSCNNSDETWSRLTHIYLNLSHIVLPPGEWPLAQFSAISAPYARDSYAEESEGTDGSDSDDPRRPPREDRRDRNFRTAPAIPVLTSFVCASAAAVQRMPVLQDMCLSWGQPMGAWLRYTVERRLGRLNIVCHPLLKLDSELVRLWEEAARSHRCEVLTIRMERAILSSMGVMMQDENDEGLLAAVRAAIHELIVGTFSTKFLYTVEFDDETLTLSLLANTSVPFAGNWISFSVRKPQALEMVLIGGKHDKANLYSTAYGQSNQPQNPMFISYSLNNATSIEHKATIPAGGNCSATSIFVVADRNPPYDVYCTFFASRAEINAGCGSVFSVDENGILDEVIQNYTYFVNVSGVHGTAFSPDRAFCIPQMTPATHFGPIASTGLPEQWHIWQTSRAPHQDLIPAMSLFIQMANIFT
ncbi:putative Carboxy-cis,cis-muconate cyclase [Seiridium unicorne]|uniref:Carboxy-cis,cis-muconate cyclase n=1 Tax=Seiridium unicorne TaxID=138068 RepID=A0ABR2VB01_9PEZI